MPHLFLSPVFNAPDECEVKPNTKAVLQEQRRTAAVQLPFRYNRHSITEKISFIHVVGGEDHCPAWGGRKSQEQPKKLRMIVNLLTLKWHHVSSVARC